MKHIKIFDLINEVNMQKVKTRAISDYITSIIKEKVTRSVKRRYSGKKFATDGIVYEFFDFSVNYGFHSSDTVALQIIFTACSKLSWNRAKVLREIKDEYLHSKSLLGHRCSVDIYKEFGYSIKLDKAIGCRLFLEELDRQIAAFEECSISYAFSHDQPIIDNRISKNYDFTDDENL